MVSSPYDYKTYTKYIYSRAVVQVCYLSRKGYFSWVTKYIFGEVHFYL